MREKGRPESGRWSVVCGRWGSGASRVGARQEVLPVSASGLRVERKKGFQMANGKEQMANVKPFELYHLPFAI
jgi:hypothetical protein